MKIINYELLEKYIIKIEKILEQRDFQDRRLILALIHERQNKAQQTRDATESLLDVDPAQETIVKIISLAIIAVIVIVGVIMAALKAKIKYTFYTQGISIGKKQISYQAISNTLPKKDWLDKIFKTYSINLGQHMHLRNINQDIEIQPYLDKLISHTASLSR